MEAVATPSSIAAMVSGITVSSTARSLETMQVAQGGGIWDRFGYDLCLGPIPSFAWSDFGKSSKSLQANDGMGPKQPGIGPGIEPGSSRMRVQVKLGEYGTAPERKGGETGDFRENPPTNGIVRHDFHAQNSGSDLASEQPIISFAHASSPIGQFASRTLHCFMLTVADLPPAGHFWRYSLRFQRVVYRLTLHNRPDSRTLMTTHRLHSRRPYFVASAESLEPMRVKRGENEGRPELKGGGSGRSPRKSTDHRFPKCENPGASPLTIEPFLPWASRLKEAPCSMCVKECGNEEMQSSVLEVAAIDLEAGVQTTPKVVKGTGEDMLQDGIDSCDNAGLEFLRVCGGTGWHRLVCPAADDTRSGWNTDSMCACSMRRRSILLIVSSVALILLSLDRRMDKAMQPTAMLILHEAEEHTTCIQADLEQGSQKCSFYREQLIHKTAPPAGNRRRVCQTTRLYRTAPRWARPSFVTGISTK
ncbi:hypothetical protein PR048_026396 [Dryococelus australis]|uniref:Uncharacterized protein n=1 Tax=Dryococelus australis TaxID=614101 RepID=A0ABQ9GL93_9NEOP|nr:hypothetical protein PR048_026396 [Dryococelus australis]